MSSDAPRKVAVLGSTGSIGRSTLDVCARVPGLNVEVYALACANNVSLLEEQVRQQSPRRVVVVNEASAEAFAAQAPSHVSIETGDAALIDLACDPEVDIVVMAIVGAAALRPTLAALEAGKTVALANKECLVMAGHLVMDAARKHGARIIPVDSEHSAAFQLALTGRTDEIERLIITSSGGALRDIPAEELSSVTPAQALDHPTWDMGPKVTIDSATIMNKALELIEAHHLFGLAADALGVWMHPQSIIHAVVQFRDGSTVLHASNPDMRLPIQYALTLDGPGRLPGPVKAVSVDDLSGIRLSPPDPARTRAIDLGLEVCRCGGTLGAVLNAANEVAVNAFLDERIPFPAILDVVAGVISSYDTSPGPGPGIDAVFTADALARQAAAELIAYSCTGPD